MKVAANLNFVKKRQTPIKSFDSYLPSVNRIIKVPTIAIVKVKKYDFFTPTLLSAVYAIGFATISALVAIKTLKNTLPGMYLISKLIK